MCMGRVGAKPLGKVKIKWTADFAYAIGLIVTDGNLSPDGRHINFTTKDHEQVLNFKNIFGLDNKIGKKSRDKEEKKKYFVIQFGDVLFYRFLSSIGIGPAKSKTLGSIKIPNKFFFHFLRGHFDGDGCTYSYFDPRWKSSYMFYTTFISASKKHVDWLREKINTLLGIKGHMTKSGNQSCYQLKYAKEESKKLLKKMYSGNKIYFLSRKRLKIQKMLGIVGEQLR